MDIGQPPGPPSPGYRPYQPSYGLQPQVRSRLQWGAYLRARLDAGQPLPQLLSEMAVSGIGQADAYFLVAEVARAMRKRALGFFVVGGIAVLVGLLVTFATLQAAQSGGGRTYIVWWGPVIFGGMAAIYGLRLLSRVPRVP
jgi:hypothetical protein